MDEQNALDWLQIWNLANGSVSVLSINFCGDWRGPWWTKRGHRGKGHTHLQGGWERRSRELQAKTSSLTLLEDFSSWKQFLSSGSVRRWLKLTSRMNLPWANCPWWTWLIDWLIDHCEVDWFYGWGKNSEWCLPWLWQRFSQGLW